ncbi:DUF4383 domain-containing protein (plasmid) [Deinococcus metallilatus]|uniref:DUF4383 domain-containing protein n=1 Tax=Deinococcus metallilatus TaxID=1211322 RepID=A0AAJ5JZY8_9DEIO|nr:DUF4383 domain-containing protein [Deinococcus metallilatus]MBB5295662.1 hypothetical protein [Deinococcus metallilatus]QBY06880.1 DUF4383 domain-containing protein [Deinococcus metallilatus]TLK32269.1 DUF4383 domain-containing protein [Deinococcus metallilatus]
MKESTVRKISLAFGAVYLLIGLLGFIPGVTVPSQRPDAVPGEGLLLGIFAVNVIHNLAHLALGAVLVWAGTLAAHPLAVNRFMAVVFLVLFVGSFIAPIVEGVNLNPADSLLHLASALLTGYLGFQRPRALSAG